MKTGAGHLSDGEANDGERQRHTPRRQVEDRLLLLKRLLHQLAAASLDANDERVRQDCEPHQRRDHRVVDEAEHY